MAFCTNCGTNVGTSVRFCTNCGTPQVAGSPPNAPLLEYGEQARAPQQQSVHYSAPPVVRASSTNKQFILILESLYSSEKSSVKLQTAAFEVE